MLYRDFIYFRCCQFSWIVRNRCSLMFEFVILTHANDISGYLCLSLCIKVFCLIELTNFLKICISESSLALDSAWTLQWRKKGDRAMILISNMQYTCLYSWNYEKHLLNYMISYNDVIRETTSICFFCCTLTILNQRKFIVLWHWEKIHILAISEC
jgi:hypothetical protein